jgi:bifunctional non-homologous end joining protein LigD
MRDFSVTAEPSGAQPKEEADARPLHFCVQKHAASHLHYDFRLEWNGVLKSWACAKGPSYVVKDKRLAVQVEDHPIEYGGFEGVIPAGQYGGGTVMLWDQGMWAPQPGHEDVDAGLQDGQLKFTLDGTKLHGKWALIRMAPRPKETKQTKPNWLLIKEHDDFERSAADPAVTEAEPDSVVTDRSLDEIAASRDHVWNSNHAETSPQAHPDRSNDPPNLAATRAEAQPAATDHSDPEAMPTEHQPTFLAPQLAQEAESPPEGAAWIHELKLDGYRMQARKSGAKVQMLTRSGIDWTARMKTIAAAIAKLPVDALTLDGEVVVLAPDGTTSFADLQASMQEGARHSLTYFCFDLLHLDGHNPRGLRLLERKRLLAGVLGTAESEVLQVSEHLGSSGKAMFHKACELGGEGIVSKRGDAPYRAGRGSAWVKSKCLHEQEFVIGGYTLPGKGNAGGPGLGALLLGFHDDAGKQLIYAGRTGTGFTQKAAARIRQQLEAIVQETSPFQSLTAEARRGAVFVRPEMVAQVRFATWTADGQVRQAAFLGLREDKAAAEVRRETAAPAPKSNRPRKTTPASPEHPAVRLTHPGKILDAASGLTKQQLADFYWAVSEHMLPHIAGRPLALVRVPEGIGHEQFFQKHVTATLPEGFESIEVPDKKTGQAEPYIALSTREAIASLAQMSVLEVHPWGSRGDDLERPDRLVIDLDPDESLPWEVLTGAALEVRAHLKRLGLESWVKTTGGKGLHVVLPIEPEREWPAIKTFCHDFVLEVERANPKLYLTKMTKAARRGKIYLDYLRNERGATAVAPYSPRARAKVGVALPLAWSELQAPQRPDFRVANFNEWRDRLKRDPWKSLLTKKQRLAED